MTNNPQQHASEPEKKHPTKEADWLIPCVNFFTKLVDKFGWFGFLLLFFVYILVFWTTSEQKTALVQNFIVTPKPQVFYVIFFAVLVAAVLQYVFYERIIKDKNREIDRLSEERTALQGAALAGKIYSGKKKGGEKI